MSKSSASAGSSAPFDPLAELSPDVRNVYPRNFAAMSLHSIFMRIGWVYKTESTIIPGFVTALTANPLIISLFPIISRIAQFVPQFFFLGVLENSPRKKPIVIAATVGMTLSWGALASILWFGGRMSAAALLIAFFCCYGFGWMCTGIDQVANRVLFGRLIPTRRRGRVIAVSGAVGSFSVLLSGPLIADLLSREGSFPRNFGIIFGIAFLFFGLTVLSELLFAEPHDETFRRESFSVGRIAREGLSLFRGDPNFRRVFLITSIQTLSMYLFSFYVAYARTWSDDPQFQRALNANLGWSLTAQNLVMGLLSLGMGLLVDWKGNRLVMRQITAFVSAAPLAAVLIGRFAPLESRLWAMLIVYGIIGQLPVLHRVTSNYLLEIAPPDRQAIYVGIWSSGQMVTVVIPVIVGGSAALIQLAGWSAKSAYEAVFVVCAGVLYLSVWLTRRLDEPRHGALVKAE